MSFVGFCTLRKPFSSIISAKPAPTYVSRHQLFSYTNSVPVEWQFTAFHQHLGGCQSLGSVAIRRLTSCCSSTEFNHCCTRTQANHSYYFLLSCGSEIGETSAVVSIANSKTADCDRILLFSTWFSTDFNDRRAREVSETTRRTRDYTAFK